MKIVINENPIEVISLTKDKTTIGIVTDIEQSSLDIVELLKSSSPIVYCDNTGEVIDTIESGYSLGCIEERGSIRTFFVKIPTTVSEIGNNDLDRLNQQITDLELALCEIYENMGV